MLRLTPRSPLRISSSLLLGQNFLMCFVSSSSSSIGWINWPIPLREVCRESRLYRELNILLDRTEPVLIFEDVPIF